ncbi:enoyl-CoA hydratase/isomerase family protein [Arthrobacter sp. STN4]|uniref:enoyl-CoA hydratase/isomerase family protein n=1 Tax=Arthrobacter sp. STN4 TaxID=2923276 RepID=UPI00211A385C|nr:enoyl-CoA hydratase/isomerase family protein [Arthrobacter sp. STN4]MCQ9163742.1 enoyl-CoA hydratase/isomerase family protein [Arthrobacter sp. STN4]
MTFPRKDLSVKTDGPISTVRIRRPPYNYFDTGLVGSLADAFESLAQDARCRAIVLASEGRHFCAGADFRGGDRRPSYDQAVHTYDMAQRLFDQPLPVVAAVQGGAIGGGLGLALAADFRVGSQTAWFSGNFASLGFHHGFGLTETLPAVVGAQKASELLLTGRRVHAVEAHALGLLDRVSEAADPFEDAFALASEIAGSGPLAVRAIRATLRQGLSERVRAAMQHEKEQQRLLSSTEDWTEGVRAVVERRTPQFVGR